MSSKNWLDFRGDQAYVTLVLGLLYCALSLGAQCIVIGPVCLWVCGCVCLFVCLFVGLLPQ